MKKREPWEVRMDAWEARMQTMWEASNKRHMERMERIDRRLDATSKILQAGAKLLVQIEESQQKLVENIVSPRNGHKGKGR